MAHTVDCELQITLYVPGLVADKSDAARVAREGVRIIRSTTGKEAEIVSAEAFDGPVAAAAQAENAERFLAELDAAEGENEKLAVIERYGFADVWLDEETVVEAAYPQEAVVELVDEIVVTTPPPDVEILTDDD